MPAALAIGVLFGAPAVASATVRFAAPGGTATAAQCTTPANPCTIFEAAQGTGVTAADEVVIASGNYSDSAGDLGPSDFVQPVAGDVHGDVGQPRPVITLDVPGIGATNGAFFISGTTLSDVEIDTAVNRANFILSSGLVERVIARSSSTVTQTIACTHNGGTIRDSACLTSGDGAAALGASLAGGVGTMNLTLRNVTAVSTGANSFGASYRFFGGVGANWIVNARSVIALGTSKDVVAGALLIGGTCPNTTVSLDFSDYATTQTASDTGCVAAVSPAGSASNQTTAPMLDADGFHQLAGSITVDHGFTDGSSGTSDIDGQLRTIGSAPDIGADELAHLTSTVVACAPAALTLGAAATCTATVTDDSTGPTAPTGKVDFSSSGAGSFGGGSRCALAMASASQATCQVMFTPSQVGTGTHQITGAYLGDTAHGSSQGSFPLGVSAPVTQGGGSGTTPPAKKCKKRKHHRSAEAAKKKKCKKKKKK